MLGLTGWLAEVCNILLAAHCVIRKVKQLITFCWHLFSWQFWFGLLQRVGLQNLSPQWGESSFDGWCSRINKGVVRQVQQGLSSIVILGTWTIWKQCSLCVFYALRALLVYLPCLLRELKGFLSPPGHGSVLWLWCMMGDPVV